MTPGDAPGYYQSGSTLTVKLSGEVAAKLSTYRREMHPDRSDEAVAAYLIRDALVHLGVLPLPSANRSKGARRSAARAASTEGLKP